MSAVHPWESVSTGLEVAHHFCSGMMEKEPFVPFSFLLPAFRAVVLGNVSTYPRRTWRGSLGQKRCSTAFYSFRVKGSHPEHPVGRGLFFPLASNLRCINYMGCTLLGLKHFHRVTGSCTWVILMGPIKLVHSVILWNAMCLLGWTGSWQVFYLGWAAEEKDYWVVCRRVSL